MKKLVIEGGATKTIGRLLDENGNIISKRISGPSNLHVVDEEVVYRNLKKLIDFFGKKNDVYSTYHFYLSGLKTNRDKKRIRSICRRIGIKGRVILGCDLLGGLLRHSKDGTGIIAVSGTGSAVYGRNRKGEEVQIGGWGERLGDEGSAYSIAIDGLKAAIRSYDGRGPKTILEKKFGKIDKLTDWIRNKSKAQIAKLAPVVFKAAKKGDAIAGCIVNKAVKGLAEAVETAEKKIDRQELFLSGGNFEHQPFFRKKFMEYVRAQPLRARAGRGPASHIVFRKMNRGDLETVKAVEKKEVDIVKAIDKVTDTFRNGGRLIYAGAGTSGRISVMDAVECNPTFNVPHNMVQAIIAGGKRALVRPKEGAEDNANAGRRAVAEKKISKKDVVAGVSASGTTPFVIGALKEAEKRGAYTILITSGSRGKAKLNIRLDTGPEIIEGSTRLKAGTAAKMVLNMISTISMMMAGNTFSNLMINVKPKSRKLIKRAIGIISNICRIREKEAYRYLKKAKFNTRNAVRAYLYKKAGELMICGFNKDKIPKDTGMAIIFKRNVKYLKKFRKKYFLTIDQEGGRISIIKKGVTLLPAMKYIKTEREAYKYGKILAKELIPLGIKLDLAPVVDVNTEPRNPIIGDRSFGNDPKRVGRLSCAMIRAMQRNGLLACAKHFPGHGAAKKDSHKCLPKIDIPYSEWEKVHFPPFKEAIKAGVSCIMTAHILCPALDKELPSSLSYKIVTGILRERFGFKGVIMTDDLGMRGIVNHFPLQEAAVLAICAGADMVIICKNAGLQKKARKAIVDAVLDGRISIERFNKSLERVERLKKKA